MINASIRLIMNSLCFLYIIIIIIIIITIMMMMMITKVLGV